MESGAGTLIHEFMHHMGMLHTFPDNGGYDQKLQATELAYLFSSERALGTLAENYVGLPF